MLIVLPTVRILTHRKKKEERKKLAKVSWASSLRKNAKRLANLALLVEPQRNLKL